MAFDRSISVVVPCYRSSESLPILCDRLIRVLSELCSQYEIILVNDGSPDNTWETIKELTNIYSEIKGINLMRNYGQHNALLCGIRTVQYKLCVTLDDDLQNPPEEIPKLIEEIEKGYDVVYGYPARQYHGFFRNLASRITKLVLQDSMGAETAGRTSSFRAFRSLVCEAFRTHKSHLISIDVLLTWGTSRFSAVEVEQKPREFGTSNYTVVKLMSHALTMLTGFSIKPLQFTMWLGFYLTLFGVGVLAYVIISYLILGKSAPGFPFLASIISIFSGAQLFALGIFGEYLARIHFRIQERPPFIIREVSTSQGRSEQQQTNE